MRSRHEITAEYHRLIDDGAEYSSLAREEPDTCNGLMLAQQAHMCRMLASKLRWVLGESED